MSTATKNGKVTLTDLDSLKEAIASAEIVEITPTTTTPTEEIQVTTKPKKDNGKPLATIKTGEILEKVIPSIQDYILRYETDEVFIMASVGNAKKRIGWMTSKGVVRDLSVRLDANVQAAIDLANRSFSPAYKQTQEDRKADRMKKNREELKALLGF